MSYKSIVSSNLSNSISLSGALTLKSDQYLKENTYTKNIVLMLDNKKLIENTWSRDYLLPYLFIKR